MALNEIARSRKLSGPGNVVSSLSYPDLEESIPIILELGFRFDSFHQPAVNATPGDNG